MEGIHLIKGTVVDYNTTGSFYIPSIEKHVSDFYEPYHCVNLVSTVFLIDLLEVKMRLQY